MFCTSCGMEIYEGHSFCTRCGKPVQASARQQAGPTAAAQMPVQQPAAQPQPVMQQSEVQVQPVRLQPDPQPQPQQRTSSYVVQPAQHMSQPVSQPQPQPLASPSLPLEFAVPATDPDPYSYDETSVLPEYSEEDMETTVQPELAVFPGVGPSVAPDMPGKFVDEPPAEPTGQLVSEPAHAQPPAESAPRLQPVVASGPLVGDDSDTLVLTGDAPFQAAPQPSAPRQSTLQLTRANGDTCMLTSFPVTVGKGSEADLVIDGNGAVSRVHVRLLSADGMFAAEDLGSTNKTYIGDYELPPHTPTILSDGDTLRLGNEVLQVQIV